MKAELVKHGKLVKEADIKAGTGNYLYNGPVGQRGCPVQILPGG